MFICITIVYLNMEFFISDLHNMDDNIIKYMHRPFEDVYHMQDTIVDNWNDTVNSEDTVWLLGDVGDVKILSQLNGIIKIVLGNHDDEAQINKMYPDIKTYDLPVMINNTTWCSHVPILDGIVPESPLINIHGHIHRYFYGIGSDWSSGRRHFNVSVENINYTPITGPQIASRLNYIGV